MAEEVKALRIEGRGTGFTERDLALPARWSRALLEDGAEEAPDGDGGECRRLVQELREHGWEFTGAAGESFVAVPMAPAGDLRRGLKQECRLYTLRRREHPLLPCPGDALYGAADLERLFDEVERLDHGLEEAALSQRERAGDTETPPETLAARERALHEAARGVCREAHALQARTRTAEGIAGVAEAIDELTARFADLGLSDIGTGDAPEAGTVARVEHDFHEAAGTVCRRALEICGGDELDESGVEELAEPVEEMARRLADLGLCDLDDSSLGEPEAGTVAAVKSALRNAAATVCRRMREIRRTSRAAA